MEPVLEYHSGTISAALEKTSKTLVDNISFSIRKGESLAVIGETGSGKTMTALSILQLLPSNVQVRGDAIFLQGQPLPEGKKMRSLLGVDVVYIPQNGSEFLNPSRKIKNQLYDNMKKLGIPRQEWQTQATEILQTVGLDNPQRVMDAYPFQLSGGMAQRVTIAISACSRAKLVIADEPTNGLDYEAKVAFQHLLKELFPSSALLIITHDIAVASFCDSVLVLCGGKTMEYGNRDAVLQSPKHPYTRALIAALVENGMQESPILRRDSASCPFYRRCPHAQPICRESQAHRQTENKEWWCNEP